MKRDILRGMVEEVRPWVTAFWEDIAFPSGVFGPVERGVFCVLMVVFSSGVMIGSFV